MRSYRLDCSLEQQRLLYEWVGCARLIWNIALEQRRIAWRDARGRTLDRRWAQQPAPSLTTQCAELTHLRAEYSWLAAVPCQVLQQKLRDLDQAFRRFFAGAAKRPVRKRKGQCAEAIRFPDGKNVQWRRLNKHSGEVKVPKIPWLRFRWSRAVCDAARRERVENVTIVRRCREWYVVFCVERPAAEKTPNNHPPVGIDRGCTAAVATSDGELLDFVALKPRERHRLARLQRRTTRQRRGSRHFVRTQSSINALHARATNRRKQFVHTTARMLAHTYGVVVLERLHIESMTRSARRTPDRPGKFVHQKRGLNRRILEKGWGALQRRLAEVCPAEGSELRLVVASYTSIRCHECGHSHPGNRKSQAVFLCQACGWCEQADVHAAKNIRELGTVGWCSIPKSAPTEGRAVAGRGGSVAACPWSRQAKYWAEASTNAARESS